VEEELEPVSRLYSQAITNRFRDRCLPFTTERSFHEMRSSSLHSIKSKDMGCRFA
jgi:hypothetical protein